MPRALEPADERGARVSSSARECARLPGLTPTPLPPPLTPCLTRPLNVSPLLIAVFFKCRCACEQSPRFSHCLCLSALTFLVPSALLLHQRNASLGGSALLLFFTSVSYHWTHSPTLRALDVGMVWLTGSLGLLQCAAEFLYYGANTWFMLSLLGIVFVVMIDCVPACYARMNGLDVIALQWHVALHLLCAASLLFFAAGDQAIDGGVTVFNAEFLFSAWTAKAAMAAAVGAGLVKGFRPLRDSPRTRISRQGISVFNSKSLSALAPILAEEATSSTAWG